VVYALEIPIIAAVNGVVAGATKVMLVIMVGGFWEILK